jgi:hypothetical protein
MTDTHRPCSERHLHATRFVLLLVRRWLVGLLNFVCCPQGIVLTAVARGDGTDI